MKKLVLLIAAVLVAPCVHADPWIKPGLWEVHVSKQVVDGKDMTAQMASAQAMMQEKLASMPAAQRAQMEQMMGNRGAAMQGGQRVCISKEMAARDKPMMPPEAKCEPTKFERSGNKTTFEINCTTDGRTTAGKGESISSGDTISSRMDMTVTDAHGRHTMLSESQMKFLGADCQGVKPIDQMMKGMQAGQK